MYGYDTHLVQVKVRQYEATLCYEYEGAENCIMADCTYSRYDDESYNDGENAFDIEFSKMTLWADGREQEISKGSDLWKSTVASYEDCIKNEWPDDDSDNDFNFWNETETGNYKTDIDVWD